MAEPKHFLQSAKLISACTLLSRILGLVRDNLCARIFGVGMVWDAFAFAWTVPNLFRRLFGEGALSAAFIPTFTEYLEKRSRKEAWELASVVATFLFLLLLALVLVGYGVCFAFSLAFPDSESVQLTVKLLYVMLPYMMLICMAALFMAALNSLNHFAAPALVPVVLNIFWIAGVIFLVPLMGRAGPSGGPDYRIFGVAIAIMVGGIFQLFLQIPVMRRNGIRLRPLLRLSDPGLRRIALVMLPVVFGLAITQINTLVDRTIALTMVPVDGAVSALYYANRLMQFPLALLGIAMATAVFPLFSRYAAQEDKSGLAKSVSDSLRLIVFLSIPASIGLVMMAEPITELLFGYGRFDAAAVSRAASVLRFYGIAVWAFCSYHVITRAFYATGDTKTPVKVGCAMVATNLILNLILVRPLWESGLALATAITAVLNVGILLYILSRRLDGIRTDAILSTTFRTLIASALMGIGCYVLEGYVFAQVGHDTVAARFLRVFIPVLSGVVAFALLAWVLRLKELKEALLPPHKKSTGD